MRENKINRIDIGEILFQLNAEEISFRFENLVAIGFRWAVVGWYEGPETNEMHLHRAEIDDGLQGTLKYFSATESNVSKEEFGFVNPQKELESLHFLKRDWFQRGEAEEIETAIEDLCEAVCRVYPESSFTAWYSRKIKNPA
jgi:hypothetical protein